MVIKCAGEAHLTPILKLDITASEHDSCAAAQRQSKLRVHEIMICQKGHAVSRCQAAEAGGPGDVLGNLELMDGLSSFELPNELVWFLPMRY